MRDAKKELKSEVRDPEVQKAALYYSFASRLRIPPEQVDRMGCRMVELMRCLMEAEAETVN